jgi:hypothetical protein
MNQPRGRRLAVARSLSISKGVVAKYVSLANASGLDASCWSPIKAVRSRSFQKVSADGTEIIMLWQRSAVWRAS